MVSGARKEARERGIFRPRYAGRRPRGAVPLRHAPRRFEVALFHMLTTRRDVAPNRAAQLAAAALHKDSAAILRAAAGMISLGFPDDPAGVRINVLDNRRWKIVREAPKLIEAADRLDRLWLEGSADALHGAFNAFALGDADLLNGFIQVLVLLGWGDQLRKLLGAREG